MEKSRRTATGKTITPKERLDKLMELCNWGQDAFMIDNPGKTFDDVMNEIRTRVFSAIETSITLEYGSRDLVDKQFKVIQDKPELMNHVVKVLQFTTGKRAKVEQRETMLEKGTDIPDEARERKEPDEKEPAAEPKQTVEPLSLEQIKKKIIDIMITFVNALVIKSDQPWKGMKFETLIKKYEADKATATRICDCAGTQECGTPFSNIYDTTYCELRGYAMLESKTGEIVYSPETHAMIMDIMDKIFAESGTLAPDWTNYIDSLIQDISKKKVGGSRHKTERNKPKQLNNNVRSTRRNNH